MQSKKRQLEPDMEQWPGPKLGKEYSCTCKQNMSCEMLGRMNHKLESRLLGEISITSDMQWYPTPVLLPGKSHGQSSLVGCSP